jgi:hypothetical protein
MAEFEPDHPDELVKTLRNWLREAQSPLGSLPEGMDPVEWAVRRFLASWAGPIRVAIEGLEEDPQSALKASKAGDLRGAQVAIESAQQTIAEDLRDELGLYSWNKE